MPDHIWKQQKGKGDKSGKSGWKNSWRDEKGGGNWKGNNADGNWKGNNADGNWKGNKGDGSWKKQDGKGGGGDGSSGGWGNKRWGKSSGKGTWKIDPEQKVWVGGVADDVDWKALQELMSQAGKVKWTDVTKGKGVGCVAFQDAAAASQAVLMFNGAVLGTGTIEVDAWAKRDS
eukprot:TRINITY_DN2509_c0_g3_i1.p1 TRINITY_DN2509_c0_g3~~TRINITY_DN2509_c0_g3_i1.p1  ORF type:complete len:198 (-),score=47.70 TRINITY_DN2509_c0_g3_i1:173-694(-)